MGPGPYHSPPGGDGAAPSRAPKGGASLWRRAFTHTPRREGVGARWGSRGWLSASACQGEDPRERSGYRLRKHFSSTR